MSPHPHTDHRNQNHAGICAPARPTQRSSHAKSATIAPNWRFFAAASAEFHAASALPCAIAPGFARVAPDPGTGVCTLRMSPAAVRPFAGFGKTNRRQKCPRALNSWPSRVFSLPSQPAPARKKNTSLSTQSRFRSSQPTPASSSNHFRGPALRPDSTVPRGAGQEAPPC